LPPKGITKNTSAFLLFQNLYHPRSGVKHNKAKLDRRNRPSVLKQGEKSSISDLLYGETAKLALYSA